MIQLAYNSFATQEFKLDAENNINNILRKAREHNSKNDITGQLIYRNGIFVQLLEGEKNKIEHLLGKILSDYKRHENVKIIFKQKMLKRVFTDWSMAYVELDDNSIDLVNSILPWQNLINLSNNEGNVESDKILRLFEKLRQDKAK